MKIEDLLPAHRHESCTPERLRKRLLALAADIREKGVRFHNGRLVVTGYAYHELYDWDMYFENLFLSYLGCADFCRNNVEMFLDEQHESGFIARTMGICYPKPRHHFKPFLAQTALLGCRQTGDYRWLDGKYYEKLKKYIDYWFWHCDSDKNGLCFWDGSDHSGMDNQALRLGYDGVMEFEGVDLNVYLVRELRAMAQLALELGKAEDAASFSAHAERLAALIDAVFWDEETGFYYDRSERTGELNRVKCVSGLLPLWLGTIPAARAERLVREHLLNPAEFWLPYPVATWAKNEQGYYQERRGGECTWMGATWIPTNYMVLHGLMLHGYRAEAEALAEKTFDMVLREATTREYYNGETGVGQGMCPFWGWSALGYVMAAEARTGYVPADPLRRTFETLDLPGLEIL